ncbi:unnamed protein product [Mytilus coruscus]|uniref:Uncharacterized protein n=1 Tax=Mytilus coruscus TaxID=42192 RepID=A0A6J7ZUL7_MYTCO|nr:unnamed protein product [Mytilus coruscus]
MEETKDPLTLDTNSNAHPRAAGMPIKKNKTYFFRQKLEPKATDSKEINLKDNCHLSSTLFISCQSRECDLVKFVQHENQSFPAALSDNGNLHSCQKLQLTNILETQFTPPDTESEAGVIILKGSALINALPLSIAKTFEEYATLEVVPKVQNS